MEVVDRRIRRLPCPYDEDLLKKNCSEIICKEEKVILQRLNNNGQLSL